MDAMRTLANGTCPGRGGPRKGLPDLTSRVFALRGRPYKGSGCHYALEHSLGAAIQIVSDLDERFDLGTAIVNEVIVSGLYADLARAERSVRQHVD